MWTAAAVTPRLKPSLAVAVSSAGAVVPPGAVQFAAALFSAVIAEKSAATRLTAEVRAQPSTSVLASPKKPSRLPPV